MKEKIKKPRTIRSSFSRCEDEGSPLSKLVVGTVYEWFDAKHRKPSLGEVGLVNSLVPSHCP